MPPLVDSSSPKLGIGLQQGSQTRYTPGDTVVGHVYRTVPTVSPHARVTVSLRGRTKPKVLVGAGLTHQTFFGRYSLFDTSETTQILQVDKPIHIQSGDDGYANDDNGALWPFAITIPSSVDHRSLTSGGIVQEQSYLPLDPHEVAAQPLPPTFSSAEGYDNGKPLEEALVEYFLEAEIQLSHGKTVKSHHSTMPLHIQHFFPGPPITNFHLQRQTVDGEVCSLRLVPGMENARLSLSQRTQKILGSSDVPKLAFRMHIDAPTILQLENANHVPLRIGFETLWDSTTDVFRDEPHQIKLESLSVCLVPTTEIKCQCSDIEGNVCGVQCASEKVRLVAPSAVRELGSDVYVPCVARKHMLTDIGEATGVRVGLRTPGDTESSNSAKAYPNFTTYNIHHGHLLSWSIRASLAGEKIELCDSLEVTLLNPPALKDTEG